MQLAEKPVHCPATNTLRYRSYYCADQDCDTCKDYLFAKAVKERNTKGYQKKYERIYLREDREYTVVGLMQEYGISAKNAYQSIRRGFIVRKREGHINPKNKGV